MWGRFLHSLARAEILHENGVPIRRGHPYFFQAQPIPSFGHMCIIYYTFFLCFVPLTSPRFEGKRNIFLRKSKKKGRFYRQGGYSNEKNFYSVSRRIHDCYLNSGMRKKRFCSKRFHHAYPVACIRRSNKFPDESFG